MKISIATQGSRGDVQPYLALAIALKAAGFEPTLVAPPNFQEWVEGFGVRFIGVGPDYSEVLASDAIRRWLEGKPGGLLEGWRGRLGEMVDAALESAIVAAENGDAILYDMKIIGAPDVAEATGKPTICISYLPNTTPTPSFPVPMFPLMQMFFAENHGPFVNSMTHVSGRLLRSFPIGHVQKWRREELGLKSELFFPRMAQTTKGFLPRLHFVSRHIAPPIDDRDRGVHTLGFLNLEDERDWSPSEELDAFLSEGEPPVFIGFGSMSTSDPERFTKTILEGVRLSGARAVLG
ncbi:MAG: glycosyltransferase, partial [Pseudomonadota bacterium]